MAPLPDPSAFPWIWPFLGGAAAGSLLTSALSDSPTGTSSSGHHHDDPEYIYVVRPSPSPTPTPTSYIYTYTSSTSSTKKHKNPIESAFAGIVFGSVFGAFLLVCAAVFLVFCCRKRSRRIKEKKKQKSREDAEGITAEGFSIGSRVCDGARVGTDMEKEQENNRRKDEVLGDEVHENEQAKGWVKRTFPHLESSSIWPRNWKQ